MIKILAAAIAALALAVGLAGCNSTTAHKQPPPTVLIHRP
jgi:predicted component of type VI protein secretion system